jgi:hypothetical protein
MRTVGIFYFQFMVIEATDYSPEETADVRMFKLQEW